MPSDFCQPFSRPLEVQTHRRQRQHDVAVGERHVVHHAAGKRRLAKLHVDQLALWVDVPAHDRFTEGADVPQMALCVDLRVRAEGHLRQVVAPGHWPLGRQVLWIQRVGRAAFPQRQHAAGVFDCIRVGDVESVRPADRRRAFDRGAQCTHHEAAFALFERELGRAHQAPAVADAATFDAELLHHAVAVKPVVVALAAALEQRRAVAIKAPAQGSRPTAAHGGLALHVAADIGDAFEGAQQRLACKAVGELIGACGLGESLARKRCGGGSSKRGEQVAALHVGAPGASGASGARLGGLLTATS